VLPFLWDIGNTGYHRTEHVTVDGSSIKLLQLLPLLLPTQAKRPQVGTPHDGDTRIEFTMTGVGDVLKAGDNECLKPT
jgi:hypothetical protein